MNGLASLRAVISDQVRLAQWFMLCRHAGVLLSTIVVARMLQVRDVGLLEMMMLCGYLVTFFWSEALLKGYLATHRDPGNKPHASTFLWIHFLTGFVIVSVLLLTKDFMVPLLTGRSVLEGIGLFMLYQLLVIGVWIAPLSGILPIRQMLFFSLYVLVGPSLALLMAASFGETLITMIIGLIIYAAVGWAWVLTQTVRWTLLDFRSVFAGIWKVSWPLMLYAISTGLAKSFDSWLVSRTFDETTFAVFRYGAREFPLVVALAAGLSTAMIPRLASHASLTELRKRSTRLMHLCFPLVALLMLGSESLFVFFFGKEYAAGAVIFNLYLLLTLTQLFFPQSVFMARKDTLLLWYVSLAELVVNIAGSLILMSYFGLMGIALGTVVAFVIEKGILFTLLQRKYGIRPFALFQPLVWLGYVVLLLLCFTISQWTPGT